MKKLIILLAAVVISMPFNLYARESKISLSAEYLTLLYDSETIDIGSGYRLAIEHSKIPVFLWGSLESTKIRYGGQGLGKTEILGLGLGYKHDIGKDLFLKILVGYYDPQNYIETRCFTWASESGYIEALYYRQNKLISYRAPFPVYEYQLDPNFGFSVGLSKRWNIYKGLSIGLNTEYRWLKFKETIYGMPETKREIPMTWWETFADIDFGGAIIGLQVRYEW